MPNRYGTRTENLDNSNNNDRNDDTIEINENISPRQLVQQWVDKGWGHWVDAKPDLPTTKTTTTNTTEIAKMPDINNYISNALSQQSDLSTDELVAFTSLSGNDILTVAKNYNISSDAQILNKNIVDITQIVNSYSPKEIIKLQGFDPKYFIYATGTSASNLYLNKSTGTLSVGLPKSAVSTNFIQIQTLIPKAINNTVYGA